MSQSTTLPDPWASPLQDIDFSNPDLFQQDAWRPYFQRLRQQSPVHYQEHSPFGPFWSITRFEDIVEIERNWEVFSSSPTIAIGEFKLEEGVDDIPTFIAMDPPRHTEQRKAVQPVVASDNLVDMENAIRGRVIEMLDALPVGETFDWVEHVSINLTTQMLALLFDFPFEDRHKLAYWSDMTTAAPETAGGDADAGERTAALQDCLQTFTRIWQQREGTDGGVDLIRLLQRDPNTAGLVNSPMEYLGTLLLLIVGGNDTTRNSISGGVVALNQYPQQYDKLRADTSLIPAMVSEIIRWQTPLSYMRRTAKQDCVFREQAIKRGDKVVLWYISANRDESVIERADEFVIDRRNPRQHLSFGIGIHRCMGSRLAEMQLRLLWEEIMKRFTFVELVGEPERVQSNFVHGYSSLPVRLHR
ncbi:MAG: cytochrome P450 [Pseudomonadota bacterium]